ncbi:MAG: ATP-binding protein [Candidatus Solibacter sp.]
MSVAGTEGTLDHLLKNLGRSGTSDRFRLVCLLSLEGSVLKCSPATLERAGLAPSDVVGRPFWTTMWWDASPDAGEEVRHAVLRAAEGGFVRCDVPSRVEKNAPHTVLLDLTVARLRGEDGAFTCLLVEARDVSEGRLAEEAIARLTAESETQRRLYEAIVSSTPDFVYVFDRDHRFVFANDALLKMWGKTREEALGKNCLELGYEPWHAEMHDREIEETVSSRRAIRGEVPFNGTGGRRIYEYIFVPVVAASGEVELITGTTRDVTDRKTTEEELRRVNQDLEQFAYSASHDLKEPLRTVKIYSELLVARYRERLDGKALDFLDNVRTGADRMEALVRDLLAYTQTSRLEKPGEPADAMAALQAALANLEAAITESGGVVEAGALPYVTVHATQLQSLFQNLIGNALKYRRPEAAPVVSISARRQDSFWLFCVADNGIGIQPEFREQIFGLFKRLHTKDEYSGTGIGLAICKRIVERYHGRIWVGSEADEGCRFYFTLPG